MRNLKYFTAAPIALLAVGVAVPVNAGVATGPMAVSALVLENCTVVATPMLFGSLTVGGSNFDTTSTLNLVCTPNADFDIALDDGTHASAGVRRMKNALTEEYIPYNIYSNSTRTTAWGSTQGTNTVPGTAPLGLVSFTAYGRIPSSAASVSAGAYADTVTVTVNF